MSGTHSPSEIAQLITALNRLAHGESRPAARAAYFNAKAALINHLATIDARIQVIRVAPAMLFVELPGEGKGWHQPLRFAAPELIGRLHE